MTKRLNIGVLGTGFIDWGGGVDQIRIILGALDAKARHGEINVTLLLPSIESKQTWRKHLYRGLIALCSKSPLQRLREVYWLAIKDNPDEAARTKILNSLTPSGAKFSVKSYKGRDGLTRLIQSQHIDTVIPSIDSLGEDFPVPWVGFIADFQHKHLPDQFSPEECSSRDELFSRILKSAPAVVVTSQSIKRDIENFYPNCNSQIIVLPFAPLPFDEWFDNYHAVVASKYNLPARYFLISSQFWRHKSHITAIEALALLRQRENCSDVKLICTGQTHDYRHPGYFDELKRRIADLGLTDSVIILGHIPKLDQIQILKEAVALVQPTLFEGSQGGLAVYDAVGLGVRAIVSDIPVNLEIQDPLVTFFKTGSAEDLERKMLVILDDATPIIDEQQLMKISQQRISLLGDKLLEAVAAANKLYGTAP